MKDAIQNKEFITNYSEWLVKNWDKLQEGKNLQPLEEEVFKLSDEDLEFVKSKKWFTDNLSIKDTFKSIDKGEETSNEELELRSKLIKLYTPGVNDKEIKEQQLAIDKANKDLLLCKRTRKFLLQFDKSEKIQTVVS